MRILLIDKILSFLKTETKRALGYLSSYVNRILIKKIKKHLTSYYADSGTVAFKYITILGREFFYEKRTY